MAEGISDPLVDERKPAYHLGGGEVLQADRVTGSIVVPMVRMTGPEPWERRFWSTASIGLGAPAAVVLVLHGLSLSIVSPLHLRLELSKLACTLLTVAAIQWRQARLPMVALLVASIAVAPSASIAPWSLHPALAVALARLPFILFMFGPGRLGLAVPPAVVAGTAACSVLADVVLQSVSSVDGTTIWVGPGLGSCVGAGVGILWALVVGRRARSWRTGRRLSR